METLFSPRSVAVAAVLALCGTAQAADDASGTQDAAPGAHDLTLSWTNTLRYSAAQRLRSADARLLANPNADDGDRNFGKGLVSNRLEVLSELDAVTRSGLGARISAAGWYDDAYNRSTDNPGFAGGAVPNHSPADQLPRKTRDLNGRKIELRDAFVFGKFDLPDSTLTARLGQHALVWGESLFFASNAIAGGQSSFDIARLLADPTAQAKEFVLPVPQVSAQWQLSSTLSLGAYYQFRHRANRLPSVGSFLSVSDTVGDGSESMWTGATSSVPRTADQKPENGGQFGLQAKWRLGETDLGFYAIRFHDKDPQQVTQLGLVNVAPGAPTPVMVVMPTGYTLAWNEATTALGFSASRSFGQANVAIEASVRNNQALASSGHAADTSALGAPASNNSSNPAYAVGRTAHVNLSTIWSLEPGSLWNEANFVGELAWNRLLSCTHSCDALDPNATRDAVSMRFVFEPTYRQVIPGLDLGVPIGLGYTPKGSRSVMGPFAYPPENGGDLTLGLNGTYEQVWRFNLAYTHFFGPAATLLDMPANPAVPPSFTYGQSRRDRDFIALSVRRSF